MWVEDVDGWGISKGSKLSSVGIGIVKEGWFAGWRNMLQRENMYGTKIWM